MFNVFTNKLVVINRFVVFRDLLEVVKNQENAGCEDDNEENHLVKQCFEEFPNSSSSRSGSPNKARNGPKTDTEIDAKIDTKIDTKIETKNEKELIRAKLVTDENTWIEIQTENYNPFVNSALFKIPDYEEFYSAIKHQVDEKERIKQELLEEEIRQQKKNRRNEKLKKERERERKSAKKSGKDGKKR